MYSSSRMIILCIVSLFAIQGCVRTLATIGVLSDGASGAVVDNAPNAFGSTQPALNGTDAGEGIAASNLAADPFTKAVVQNAKLWKESMYAQVEIKNVSAVMENGLKKNQVNETEFIVDGFRIETSNHNEKNGDNGSLCAPAGGSNCYANGAPGSIEALNPDAKEILSKTVSEVKKVDGTVTVICPILMSQEVENELNKVGVTVAKDKMLISKYKIKIFRKSEN